MKQKWEIQGASPESILDRYEYAYDRMSNRKSRDVTPTSPPSGKDEYYVYDGLHRLQKSNRGDLAGDPYDIDDGDADFNQHWSELESLGNWRQFKWDPDGGGEDPWTTQNRKHNKVNEIDNDDDHGNSPVDTITGNGADWVDPVQDAAGNMTTIPQPGTPTSSYTCVYDAWNRLVKVAAGETTVAEYRHDPPTCGAGKRYRPQAGSTL